jgi:hydroxyethylthiazole kinase-like uncharacterized protein yjeF
MKIRRGRTPGRSTAPKTKAVIRAEGSVSVLSIDELSLSQRLLPSAKEMRALDEAAIALGLSSARLMESAGDAVAAWVKEAALALRGPRHISILCGPGNNGGDGLVALRLLKKVKGIKASAFIVAARRYSPDFLEQLARARAVKCDLSLVLPNAGTEPLPAAVAKLPVIGWDEVTSLLASDCIVLDALLGTGQNSAPQGEIEAAVQCLSKVRTLGPRIFSVDIPTGVDASEGRVFEPAVHAHETLAIECLKRGMLQYPARSLCGVLKVAPIGILDRALRHLPPPPFRALLQGDPILKLPSRHTAAHKGNFKRVLVVGGSRAMPGAPVLAGEAALRVGAALVSVTYVQGSPPVLAAPELMRISYDEDPSAEWWPALAEWTEQHTTRGSGVVVLGPGLGAGEGAAKLVELVIALTLSKDLFLVLDADGLNALSSLLASGKKLKLPRAVLTPHPGEMARLLAAVTRTGTPGALTAAEIQSTRHSAASYLATVLSTTVVLKGASSIVVSGVPEGEGSETCTLQAAVNLSGTPWMATGGSGDVLSGMVAGFLAQGLEPYEAAAAAVYYHGCAGEIASGCGVSELASMSGHPIIASDLISALPRALEGKFSGASRSLSKSETKVSDTAPRPTEVH